MKRVLFPLAVILFICASVFSETVEETTFSQSQQPVFDTVNASKISGALSKASLPVSGINRQSRPFTLTHENSQGQYSKTQSEHFVKWPLCLEKDIQKNVSLILLNSHCVEIDLTIKKIIFPFHTFS